MLKTVVHTEADYALTISRFTLGALFFVHGSQLMPGWFGGYGFSGSMQFFTRQLGIPAIFAQFFGGLMLIVGSAGRVAAPAVTPRSYRTNNTRGNR